MSSNQGDGGERGEQEQNQTDGQGSGQPQQDAPQDAGQGQPADGQPADGQPAAGQPPQGQPAQGQPAAGQGQPAGGQGAPPAGGQQPVRRGPSTGQQIQAAFGDYAVKNQIKAIVGTWVLIGVGLGFTAVFLGAMGGRAAGVLGPASVPSFAVAAGPVVAAIFGLSFANRLPVETTPGAFVSAATNYAGFLLAALIAVFLAETQTGAFSTIQPGQLIVPILVAGLLVAVTAGLVTALGRKVDYPATREEAEAQEPPAPAPQPQHAQQPQQPQ